MCSVLHKMLVKPAILTNIYMYMYDKCTVCGPSERLPVYVMEDTRTD